MGSFSIGDIVISECGVTGLLVGAGVGHGGQYFDIHKYGDNIVVRVKTKIHLLRDVSYIKSFKHMIGVVGVCGDIMMYVGNNEYYLSVFSKFQNYYKFYDEDSNLLTYKEYMRLYYPEYEFIWKEQLSE